MHTARHNPSHDNGYKVYFADGAGIIDPGASNLSNESMRNRRGRSRLPNPGSGCLTIIGAEVDAAYRIATEGSHPATRSPARGDAV